MEGNAYEFAQVLDEMASSRFEGTELGDWGFFPTEPQKLRRELNSRQLALVGAFVPINFLNSQDLQKGLAIALKISRLLAETDPKNARLILADDNGKNPTRTKNAGRIQKEHGMTFEQWDTFTSGVEYVAQTVRNETDIPVVFHHHCAGHIETPREIDYLLEKTDSKLIGLCFDTGHYKFGGGDVLDGLKKHRERIEHVHFKDFDPLISKKSRENEWDYFQSIQHGIFCELGKGSIDFKSIFRELKRYHICDWIVVEQDVLPGMGTPKENAIRNRKYLKFLII
jgi:inosose dehydratase